MKHFVTTHNESRYDYVTTLPTHQNRLWIQEKTKQSQNNRQSV